MELDEHGYTRPVRRGGGTAPKANYTKLFRQICPGVRVLSPRPAGSIRHPTFGPIVSAWEAWAADPEFRYTGSSGGVLTALAAWLTQSGELTEIVGVTADPANPRRTIPMSITGAATALSSAGSRYAPVSALSHPAALQPRTGLIGKPCESSAARALIGASTDDDGAPLLLSFFCAGTPSQFATDRLVIDLGVRPREVLRRLWYRGHGWPGRFTAETTDGTRVSASYDESWGNALGPAVQWRCKICPDGVGESSDISAADFWRTDVRGYPDFTESDGCSAVLARTLRGHEILSRAFAAGVIVGRPLDVEALSAAQPLQVSRRATLLGRLIGSTVAGRAVPHFRSFGLLRMGATDWRTTLRTGRGTFRRVRRDRQR